jgi:outer membrane protein assembly factor BamB
MKPPPLFPAILFCLCFAGSHAGAQTMKWHYNLKDVSFGQTTARDVDGDGKLELIFSTYWNDSNVYCLNSETGTLRWKHALPGPMGGCNDAAPLVFDPFNNGNYKVVIPGSCMDTTFCLDADSGFVQWKTITGGGDSPPTTADVNGDGIPDVLHGTFSGNVQCLNGRTGAIQWTLPADAGSAIESEPVLFKNGAELDFAIATWDFTYDSNRIACYKASDHSLKWKYYTHNLLYHGAATGDLFRNGQKELVIGDYDGYLYCFRSGDGALLWKDSTSKLSGGYIGAPVTLADINNDGYLDIIYMDGNMVRVVNRNDSTLWTYTPTADFTNFRGAVVADVNNDHIRDVTFCTDYGKVTSLDGLTGAVIRTYDIRNYAMTVLGDTSSIFEVDNAPIIADFDADGVLDLFIIAGKGRSDATSPTDYGYAFCLSWGVGTGPAWTMFRHDEFRTGCLCDSMGLPLNVAGSEQHGTPGLGISPNPSNGVFSVTANLDHPETITVSLTDVFGRAVIPAIGQEWREGVNTLNFTASQTASLLNGIYFIRIDGSSMHGSQTVVINR